ncbi:MAG: ABC transporter permease [Methanomassiliicoccus sp.]|nr:ABC transporter permease [Methanomassiliicoccus sp.]
MNVYQSVRVFWSSSVMAKKALFHWLSPGLWLMQLFTMSLFQIAFFVFIAEYVGNPQATVAYVAVGNAIQSIAYVAIFAVTNVTTEEKEAGTLPGILATPANRFAIFVGRAMFQVLNSIATVAIALFYAAVIFGVDFSHADWLTLAVVIVVTAFATVGFGLMLSSLGFYLRTSMVVANVFLFMGLLFCGVNFPVTMLPEYLQPISYALPVTYATDAARMAVDGASLEQVGGLLGAEVLVMAVAIFIGYLMMLLFEHLARRRGTLEMF